MSFQYIVSYQEQLKTFLSAMNPNINWSKALNEIITFPIEKLLSRIRSHLWTDKDELNDEYEVIENTYVYYQRLLCLLESELDGKQIYIIGEPRNNEDKLVDNDVVNNKVSIKFEVLTNLLKFKRVRYVVIHDASELNSIDASKSVVFPTCSVMYNKSNEFEQKLSNVRVVDDGYYNLYTDERELEFNVLRLMLVELFNNPAFDIQELLKNKYGMLKVKPELRMKA